MADSMTSKILVVEDEVALRETLEYNLAHEGHTVCVAADGHTAVEAARREKPDLVVLDVMLPGLDGFEVCRLLRQDLSAPIIMLTARTDEIDRVVGLEVGADDYVTKPFSMRELLARVKAQLRRVRLEREEGAAAAPPPVGGGRATSRLTCGNLVIDVDRHEVLVDGTPARVQPREYDLLVYLVRNRGLALSREQILAHVWGWEYDGASRTVDVHIRGLRKRLEEDPANPRRIVTVRGSGYRFEG